jgi:hypothetical protein
MLNGKSSAYCSQEGYHTFRGGFWNYFSMGKKFEFVTGFLLIFQRLGATKNNL